MKAVRALTPLERSFAQNVISFLQNEQWWEITLRPPIPLATHRMQSVLVPEIYISQCEVIASLPPITQRICFDKPSGQQARLPFRDVRRGVLAGKRPTPKTKFTASQIEQECNEQTKKKLNERLHAEQSYACGLSVRIRLHPKKYQRMKIERRFTSEELFVLAEEAIRRSGVVLD